MCYTCTVQTSLRVEQQILQYTDLISWNQSSSLEFCRQFIDVTVLIKAHVAYIFDLLIGSLFPACVSERAPLGVRRLPVCVYVCVDVSTHATILLAVSSRESPVFATWPANRTYYSQ